MIYRTIIIFMLLFTQEVLSNEVMNDYIFYQSNDYLPKRKVATYAVYLKKNDPCIHVIDMRKNADDKFCKMGDSGLDLQNDYPTIYPTMMYIGGGSFYFHVAAPWNEQKCEIKLYKKSINCESTGK
ncbi:hypothetical protein Vspart_01438 [Vibrio spartinae]|uniref:Uncharacterized protein n=2 Tax=Vibrio spartinae TaxID=1918945 RepID=A0ABX6QYU7_9VIBR|nr:hypothetical protein Vspart_01438 [Vibrio spartinae]